MDKFLETCLHPSFGLEENALNLVAVPTHVLLAAEYTLTCLFHRLSHAAHA
jgi:hypothetical protein